MLALLIQDFKDIEDKEQALTIVLDKTAKRFIDKLVIFILNTYKEVIKDPIQRELQLEAIQAELIALISNSTQDVIILLKGANLVISKWVFKAKIYVDGTLDKLKARIIT